MVNAIRTRVQIQPGGKIELTSSDLPAGQVADVIVVLPGATRSILDYWGLFADCPDVMDQVLAMAMADRSTPLRLNHE